MTSPVALLSRRYPLVLLSKFQEEISSNEQDDVKNVFRVLTALIMPLFMYGKLNLTIDLLASASARLPSSEPEGTKSTRSYPIKCRLNPEALVTKIVYQPHVELNT